MTDTTTTAVAPEGTTPVTPAITATPDPVTATAPVTGEASGVASTATPEGTPVVEGAPEAYTDFTMPEGYVLDGERLELLKTLGKEKNWTQAQAQEMVTKHIELSQAGIAMAREAMVTADEAQSRETFATNFDTIAADAQFGITHVAKSYPEAIEVFDSRGWGSNRVALYAFAELGRLARGDKLDGMGNSMATGSLSIAERLWPTKT